MSNLTQILELVYVDYIVTVVLATYLIIVHNKNQKKTVRVRLNMLVSLVFAVIFYAIGQYTEDSYSPTRLMVSAFCTVAAYEWLLKRILKIFGADYKSICKSHGKCRIK